ncbi:hypothetical protein KIPB_006820, partial [Kipferlia bialata]
IPHDALCAVLACLSKARKGGKADAATETTENTDPKTARARLLSYLACPPPLQMLPTLLLNRVTAEGDTPAETLPSVPKIPELCPVMVPMPSPSLSLSLATLVASIQGRIDILLNQHVRTSLADCHPVLYHPDNFPNLTRVKLRRQSRYIFRCSTCGPVKMGLPSPVTGLPSPCSLSVSVPFPDTNILPQSVITAAFDTAQPGSYYALLAVGEALGDGVGEGTVDKPHTSAPFLPARDDLDSSDEESGPEHPDQPDNPFFYSIRSMRMGVLREIRDIDQSILHCPTTTEGDAVYPWAMDKNQVKKAQFMTKAARERKEEREKEKLLSAADMGDEKKRFVVLDLDAAQIQRDVTKHVLAMGEEPSAADMNVALAKKELPRPICDTNIIVRMTPELQGLIGWADILRGVIGAGRVPPYVRDTLMGEYEGEGEDSDEEAEAEAEEKEEEEAGEPETDEVDAVVEYLVKATAVQSGTGDVAMGRKEERSVVAVRQGLTVVSTPPLAPSVSLCAKLCRALTPTSQTQDLPPKRMLLVTPDLSLSRHIASLLADSLPRQADTVPAVCCLDAPRKDTLGQDALSPLSPGAIATAMAGAYRASLDRVANFATRTGSDPKIVATSREAAEIFLNLYVSKHDRAVVEGEEPGADKAALRSEAGALYRMMQGFDFLDVLTTLKSRSEYIVRKHAQFVVASHSVLTAVKSRESFRRALGEFSCIVYVRGDRIPLAAFTALSLSLAPPSTVVLGERGETTHQYEMSVSGFLARTETPIVPLPDTLSASPLFRHMERLPPLPLDSTPLPAACSVVHVPPMGPNVREARYVRQGSGKPVHIQNVSEAEYACALAVVLSLARPGCTVGLASPYRSQNVLLREICRQRTEFLEGFEGVCLPVVLEAQNTTPVDYVIYTYCHTRRETQWKGETVNMPAWPAVRAELQLGLRGSVLVCAKEALEDYVPMIECLQFGNKFQPLSLTLSVQGAPPAPTPVDGVVGMGNLLEVLVQDKERELSIAAGLEVEPLAPLPTFLPPRTVSAPRLAQPVRDNRRGGPQRQRGQRGGPRGPRQNRGPGPMQRRAQAPQAAPAPSGPTLPGQAPQPVQQRHQQTQQRQPVPQGPVPIAPVGLPGAAPLATTAPAGTPGQGGVKLPGAQ